MYTFAIFWRRPTKAKEGDNMEPIQSRSLRERVITILRDAIINGELLPGQPLVGTELASQIGVSQATLRDAIYALSLEGLVDTVAYHVSTVKQLSKKDIEDLFGVRSMLESYAIRQIVAAEKRSPALRDLFAICDEMEAAAALDSLTDVNRIDRRFHSALIEHSGNELLGVLWSSVAQRVQQVMSLSNLQQGDLRQIAVNHRAIVTVMENEDTEEAVRLMNAHISYQADEIAEGWNGTGAAEIQEEQGVGK